MQSIKIINTSNNEVFYATEKSVGFDIAADESVLILPLQVKKIKTGLKWKIEDNSELISIKEAAKLVKCCTSTIHRQCKKGRLNFEKIDGVYFINKDHLLSYFNNEEIIDLPEKYELQIRPRSSSLLKEKLHIQIGTIDPDYTGEICIIAQNISFKPKLILKGERIAQGIISKVCLAENVFSRNIIRNNNGFGSTGK
nr:hypothetical protein GTC16762_33120 [Pigmentibacter ruber]